MYKYVGFDEKTTEKQFGKFTKIDVISKYGNVWDIISEYGHTVRQNLQQYQHLKRFRQF